MTRFALILPSLLVQKKYFCFGERSQRLVTICVIAQTENWNGWQCESIICVVGASSWGYLWWYIRSAGRGRKTRSFMPMLKVQLVIGPNRTNAWLNLTFTVSCQDLKFFSPNWSTRTWFIAESMKTGDYCHLHNMKSFSRYCQDASSHHRRTISTKFILWHGYVSPWHPNKKGHTLKAAIHEKVNVIFEGFHHFWKYGVAIYSIVRVK